MGKEIVSTMELKEMASLKEEIKARLLQQSLKMSISIWFVLQQRKLDWAFYVVTAYYKCSKLTTTILKSMEVWDLLYVGMQPTALRHLAEHHPSELKQAISTLFNEAMPLNDRVEKYINICDNCWDEDMRKMYGDTTKSCADERLASDFLTCHDPHKYTFYKNSVYESFCKYLGKL